MSAPGITVKYTVPSKICQTSAMIPSVDIPSCQALLFFVEGFPFSFEIPATALVKKTFIKVSTQQPII